MRKRTFLKLSMFVLGISLMANADEMMTISKAESLVSSGKAQIISKKELNNIKKNNISVEIKDLESKKVLILRKKKDEISGIEHTRAKEIEKINSVFDEKRLKIENLRNSDISDIKKMVVVKQKEMDMIDKIESIALKAEAKEKALSKLITINDIKGLKAHIGEYKHINNVLMKLSLVDGLKLYLHGKENKYNYGVLKKIKDYTLKIAYNNKSLEYDVFEGVLTNGTDYDIKQLIKILERERIII